jgi:predicted ATPase
MARPPGAPMPSRLPHPASTAARWYVRVLGQLSAADGQQTLTRFGSGSVAALLARLALHPRRSHAREELVELLWPGVEPEVGRNRLRQTIFALRTLLEPPGPVPQPVLIADRSSVRVLEGSIECDAVEFERALREGRHTDALALYGGELLPGHYAEWIDDERLRLAALADRAVAAQARTAPAPAPQDGHGPPAAARRERSTLPVYLTRFFGREAELEALHDAIAAHRLVTLLGPGGAGKTRLAVEVATALRDMPAFDPLLFVPLIGCTTRDAFIDALVTGLRLPPGEDRLGQVVDALAERRCLLVLDTFEQLVETGADVLARLTAELPGLHLLVTSRRALGLDGEREVLLPPLAPPPSDASLAEAAGSPALALFVDRARAARTDFHLGARNRATLVELAQVLEGLPLALELAASRIRSVSPAEMLAQLRPMPATNGTRGRQLELLARTGPRTGADPRHTSMQRAIEWSWRLLAPSAQRLMAELTVFEGGFGLDAAAAVTTPSPVATALAVDELVAQSLLNVSTGADGTTRFGLSQPIREFAAGTLVADAVRELRRRHRRWVTAWGAALPLTPSLDALRAEMPNLAAGLASALADGVPQEGTALLVAWRRGLLDTTVPAVVLAQADTALQATADAALASRGHTLLARLCLAAGQGGAARRHAEAGLALARQATGADASGGHDDLLARALHGAASVEWRTLRQAARPLALLDEAEPLAERGEAGVRASLLALRAFIANVAERDLTRAEALHAQALALWEHAGDTIAANNGRYNLAVCAMRARRHREGLARLAEVVRQAERQHDWRLLSQAWNVEGEAHWGLRQWHAAAAAYRRSAELAWSVLAQQPLAYALWNLPHALARLREPERAARLGAASERFWVAQIGPLDAADQRELRLLRRLVAVQIGPARTDAAWRAGATLSSADAVELALQALPPPLTVD